MQTSKPDNTPNSGQIAWLDFAKGYAMLGIILFHAFQKLPLPAFFQKAIMFGGSGVHLFFLLSGFGLVLSRPLPLWAFYRRRMVKVWLPYSLALSLSLGAAMVWHIFPDRWAAWLAGVCLYQMFIEAYVQSFGGHFWFMSAIIQFYLLFPLLSWLLARQGPKRFFLTALACSLFWWLLVSLMGKAGFRSWNSFFLQFLWEFALGMALAAAYGNRGAFFIKGAFWRYSTGWYAASGLFFSVLMIVMILKMGEAGRIFNDIPAMIGYSGICLLVFRLLENRFRLLVDWFCRLGRLSFSIYLTHVLVLEFLLQVAHIPPSPMLLLCFIPLALLFAAGFDWLSKRLVTVKK